MKKRLELLEKAAKRMLLPKKKRTQKISSSEDEAHTATNSPTSQFRRDNNANFIKTLSPELSEPESPIARSTPSAAEGRAPPSPLTADSGEEPIITAHVYNNESPNFPISINETVAEQDSIFTRVLTTPIVNVSKLYADTPIPTQDPGPATVVYPPNTDQLPDDYEAYNTTLGTPCLDENNYRAPTNNIELNTPPLDIVGDTASPAPMEQRTYEDITDNENENIPEGETPPTQAPNIEYQRLLLHMNIIQSGDVITASISMPSQTCNTQ